MRLKKLLHLQSGRSLVEMLAALVIIGILSLVGLYGIEYAMEKNRENETLDRFSKVVAGSRTSRILETLGDKTKYNQKTGAERTDGYAKMAVDMHDVISNIGEDIFVSPTTDVDGEPSVISHIIGPLKGPIDNMGNTDNVKIYVYVETPEAFTVHAENLTLDACMKIVQTNLGYTFTYETNDDTTNWRVPSQVQTEAGARALCEKVVQGTDTVKVSMMSNPFVSQALAAASTNKQGTLVMWFGPYACMGDGCTAGLCNAAECCCEFSDGGRQVQLKDPAPVGCKPVSGRCISCATPDSKGICAPKPGFSSCEPSCPVNVCQNTSNPYYCGNGLCCPSKETCGIGSCTGKPVDCKDPARPNKCGTQCCGTDEQCNNGICEPKNKCDGTKQTCTKQTDGEFSHCCNQDETCCDTKCCSANETCMPDGTCEPSGKNEYCVASIFKTGRCIQKEVCNGKVLPIPGYTVQRCEDAPTKEVIYVYNSDKTGPNNDGGEQCLFTLCAGGKNGQPCCPCGFWDTSDYTNPFACLNGICTPLTEKDIYDLNKCTGYIPPEPDPGDPDDPPPPPPECSRDLSKDDCEDFGGVWCEENFAGSGEYSCCCPGSTCHN